MKKLILTVLGQDRPGIVAEVTGVLFKHHCNIEDSSMTILEGEFAMLLVVSLPENMNSSDLKEKFDSLVKKSDLYINIKSFAEGVLKSVVPEPRNYVISVIGADKPGIVYHIAKLLAEHDANITDVETKRIGKGDRVVYAMILESNIPVNVKIPQLESEFAELGKKLSVEITIKPIESLTF
ncbi:MAG: ACT domain-containing protein [Candidatus Omnitrophica bacterium]|nr:ACT domain-containing protein [Candidatus Omnitrophota bacterium]